MNEKEKSKKWLKTQNLKVMIMETGPINSWQIYGEKW